MNCPTLTAASSTAQSAQQPESTPPHQHTGDGTYHSGPGSPYKKRSSLLGAIFDF